MEFIGNNAKTPKEFLDFMGQPKGSFGGSPIPIHFPDAMPSSSSFSTYSLRFHTPPSIPCNTSDPFLRCSCMDCDLSCPTFSPGTSLTSPTSFLKQGFQCSIGSFNCIGLVGLLLWIFIITSWAVFFILRHFKYRNYESLSQSSPLHPEESGRIDYPVQVTEDGIEPSLPSPEFEPLSSHFRVTQENEPPPSLHSFFERWFYSLGYACAKYPITIILMVSLLWLLSSSSLLFRSPHFVTDPVGLWVPPDSSAATSKAVFDQNFGPFYRIQQLIISTTSSNDSLLTAPNVQFLFSLKSDLLNIKAKVNENQTIQWTDLCLKPLQDEGGCMIESITGYWQNDILRFDPKNWWQHLSQCLEHPGEFECLPPFKRPILSEHVLNQGLNSTSFIITLVNQNSHDTVFLHNSKAWESELSHFLNSIQLPSSLRLSFNTESSIEKELRRSTKADFPTIALSYIAMFFYIVAQLKNPGLGMVAVLIVLASVSTAIGLFTWFQFPLNFVVLEVIPFLALAIGVDNLFLLVEGYHQVALFRSIPERIALAVAQRGPGCLISFLIELFIFLTASLIQIPVVTQFALSSSLTVTCLFIFQFTIFLAIMSLSLVPEIKHRASSWTLYLTWLSTWRHALYWSFLVFFLGCVFLLTNGSMGLDQKDVLPKNSNLTQYLDDFAHHYHVGPPVYFMVQNVSLTNLEQLEKLCSKFTSCQENSIPNLLDQSRKQPNITYLDSPVTTWLDDFLVWLRPSTDPSALSCCSIQKNSFDQLIPTFCTAQDSISDCQSCVLNEDWKLTNLSRLFHALGPHHLKVFLHHWLSSTPSETCPLAGGAAYQDSVNLTANTFAYRLNSVPLTNQHDYIQAYTSSSTHVLDTLQHHHPELDISVYSVFHVYFAQYPHLISMTFKLLFLSLINVIWLSLLFLRSFRATCVLSTSMILFTLLVSALNFGVFLVPLNAVSVVNFIMGIGLGVEFCVHIIKAFYQNATSLDDQIVQVHQTMFLIGSSVLSGIGWTKLVGILVLAFAQAHFFRIYFFTMYLCILVAGLIMSFMVLPILLYFFGGRSNDNEDTVDELPGTF
ncbi:hypothetical protein HMI56_007105 [Coelomomyces lativittatus]|nr:hypothetical protein HMI56_007105 [Coelomomyces lativittatus]